MEKIPDEKREEKEENRKMRCRKRGGDQKNGKYK
jgi:hypothetical protein